MLQGLGFILQGLGLILQSLGLRELGLGLRELGFSGAGFAGLRDYLEILLPTKISGFRVSCSAIRVY